MSVPVEITQVVRTSEDRGELLIPIPGIVTGAAYSAGDAFGTLLEIHLPEGVKSGVLATAVFLDLDDEGLETDLVLCNQPFVPTADNEAFAITDVELLRAIGTVTWASFKNFNGNQISTVTPNLEFVAPRGILWGQHVARGTPNIAAGHIPQIRLVFRLGRP